MEITQPGGSGGGITEIDIGITPVVGGADTQVLFIDAGTVGADSGLTYVKATDTLTIAGSQIVPLISGSTAANGDITINGTTSATKTSSYVALQNAGGGVVIGSGGAIGKFTLGATAGANGGMTLDLLAEGAAGTSYSSIDFTVPTTGLMGQFFATAANYNNSNSLAANSIGLLAEATSGQLLLGAIGGSGYVSFITGGLATTNERMRIASTGAVTIGQNLSGTAKALVVNNGTSTGNIFEAQDNGTAVFTVADGGLTTLTGQLHLPISTAANPSIYFAGATNYGIYYGGGVSYNEVGITIGGVAQTILGDSVNGGITLGKDLTLKWSNNTSPAATRDTFLGREAAAILQMGLDVNGAPVNQTFKAHDGITGTDKSGASMTIAGGRGTGTGVGADYVVQTAKPLSTGTTAQTLGDRVRVLQKYTTLTAATPTVVATVAVGTGIATGGDILISVEANDATDFQCRTLRVTWSAVNKAGTITAGIDTPSEAIAVSTGTLTAAVTVADAGSGILNILVDAASSLTETVLRANCQVRKNFGTGAIA